MGRILCRAFWVFTLYAALLAAVVAAGFLGEAIGV
jgi:hypothetical protein